MCHRSSLVRPRVMLRYPICCVPVTCLVTGSRRTRIVYETTFALRSGRPVRDASNRCAPAKVHSDKSANVGSVRCIP